MYKDVPIANMPNKVRVNEYQNENVIRLPNQNTLNTKVKQIRNPQKKISGGFLFDVKIIS